MSAYEPEMGQAAFGHPWQPQECSDALRGVLAVLSAAWAEKEGEMSTPFDNSAIRYDGAAFSAHAYSWTDDEQEWNFKWRDLRVSWYKYLGRGMSCNRDLTPQECVELLAECMAEIAA